MFEIVAPRPRRRWRLRSVAILTRGQQLRLAALAAVAGAIAALAGVIWLERKYPAPIEIVRPQIEHSGGHLEVIRFGLAYRGAESHCRFVLYKGRDQWQLECFPEAR